MSSEKIEYLVETHLSSVFQFCCYLTGNRLDAEDLCQDTFLKAMELSHKFPCGGTERDTRNYLIGIAVHLWKNLQRKKHRRQRIAPEETLEETFVHQADEMMLEDQVIKQELIGEVQKEIGRLPEKQRLVVHLFYSAEMSMEEIAGLLHIPRETVKSRLRLAKRKIRKRLEVRGYEVSSG